ncbi:MAG: C25 family cysteine peptidase [candidate division WOR-3 bacterium]
MVSKKITKGVIFILLGCVVLEASWVPFRLDNRVEKTAVNVLSSTESSVLVNFEIFGAEVSEYDARKLTDTGDEVFAVFKIDEYAFTGEIGRPQLPMITAVLDVPHKAEIRVEVISADYNEFDLKTLGINKRIAPALQSVPKIPNARAHFVLDQSVYSTDAFYPDKIADIYEGDGGLARGHRLATLRVYPVHYNPVTGKIRCYTKIKVNVDFVGGDILETQRVIARDYSTMWEQFIQRTVINYPEYLKGVPPLPIYYDIFYNGQAQTVARKLAQWKKKKGYKVRMWNAGGWSATAINDTIRFQNPLATFLVIMGDPNSSSIALPPSGTGSSSGDQTDLYYAETNESGYLPDMFNARISILDTAQGNTVVNKAIRWEHANFGSAGYSWLKKACFIAGYDASWQNFGMATNWYCRNLLVPYGYTVDTLVYAYGEQEGRVVSQINAGRAWMVYTAHGSQTSWAVGYSGDFNVTELTNLTNNLDMYPMPCGHCCLTGDYEYSSNCFGETWDRLSGKGGICYFGSVPSTFWYEDDWLQRRYFDAIYTDSITGRLYETGRFTQWGLYWIENNTSSDNKRYYFEAYHLFNDPSLDFWTDVPDTLLVTHNPFVVPGTSNFTVNVKDNNGVTPLKDALVCLWIYTQTPELHVAGYTDANGNVTLSVSAQNPMDTMWVTVTKHNYRPYEGYALVQDVGMPAVPTVTRPLDFARLPYLQPTLSFYSTDPNNDQLQYRVLWDEDPNFTSPDSATTGLYNSGVVVNFVFPSALQNGMTYWWKVKCRDPNGSGYWTQYTTKRSFTVGTSLPQNTCSWYQTTNAQFNFDIFNGTQVQGDSVVLLPSGQTVVDSLLFANFESGLPSGWTVVNSNGDQYQWTTGTTSDLGSYTPPDYGSAYAYYSDDDAGSSAPVSTEEGLVTPRVYVGGITSGLELVYGYGYNDYSSYDYYRVRMRRFVGGSWQSWVQLREYNADGSGNEVIGLDSYLPCDSMQFEWYYTETSATWGWACAVDNVLLRHTYQLSNDYGTLTGTPVVYHDLSTTYPRSLWGDVVWRKASAGDSIGIQVEYYNGSSWQLIPNSVLPGNSGGFFTNLAVDTVKLTNVDTVVYNTLRLKALFYRVTKSPNNPALLDWEVGNLSGYGIADALNTTPYLLHFSVSPNPFRNHLVIHYALSTMHYALDNSVAGAYSIVPTICIYDVTGRLVRDFSRLTVNGERSAVIWDGTDDSGRRLPCGVYFVRLEAGDFKKVEKAVLLR